MTMTNHKCVETPPPQEPIDWQVHTVKVNPECVTKEIMAKKKIGELSVRRIVMGCRTCVMHLF